MAKYRASMTAFGLARGDTFESNDPRWDDQVAAGNLVRVDDDTELTITGGVTTLSNDGVGAALLTVPDEEEDEQEVLDFG